MSDINDPQPPSPPPPGEQPAEQQAPYVIPVRYTPPAGAAPAPPARRRSVWTVLLVMALAISVGVNLLLLLVPHMMTDLGDGGALTEHYHSGKTTAHDKIAIIKMDGVIMEGSLAFVQKQIEQAASDASVKAIVLRINSPGGTITGSDDLYRRLKELREGEIPQQKGGKKTLVASMGGMAASGGYYIAMPAEFVFAERTTITGSIGVYAAFPNISGLAETYGFGMNVIKAGDIKDSGSMFKKMTPQERQLWQDMVDHAYARFTEVVEEGRESKLTAKLTDIVIEKEIPDVDPNGKPNGEKNGEPKTVKYVRRLADGGIWTAEQAKKFGLVDQIGYLEEAIKETAKRANLTGPYKAVTYEKQPTLSSLLLGAQAKSSAQLDPDKLAAGAIPRLWYLAPQAEMAGILAAMGKQ
ncbi:hypothetical protein AYO44_00805 [Planctomycetaceae bacterium SCGC AG-212-F19]|nr:hypothetical protein AYO44_00805 [Planctomycetaceae bacterium SCGC AG-212-F19]